MKTNVSSSGASSNRLPKSGRLYVNGRLYAILIVTWCCKAKVEELPLCGVEVKWRKGEIQVERRIAEKRQCQCPWPARWFNHPKCCTPGHS